MNTLMTHRWSGRTLMRWTLLLVAALLGSGLVAAPAQAANGTLSGTVRLADGSVADHVHVELWNEAGSARVTTSTPSNPYAIQAPPGTYRVCFSNHNQWPRYCNGGTTVPSQATPTVIGSGTTTTLNVQAPALGTLSGTVADDVAGDALKGARVALLAHDAANNKWLQVRTVKTRADGTYSTKAVPGTYRLRFSLLDTTRFHPGASTVEAAQDVTIAAGQTSQVNGTLPKPGTISGTVTAAAEGVLRGDRWVTAINLASGEHFHTFTRTSGPTMNYDFGALAGGDYRVEFARVSGPAIAEGQYSTGIPESQGPAGADVVTVTPGAASTVNGTLRAGGTLTGTIVGANGGPGQGCDVAALPTDPGMTPRSTRADASGAFTITGLTTTTYELETWCAGARYYVSDNGTLTRVHAQATPIAVSVGATRDVGQQTDSALLFPFVAATVRGTPEVGATLTVDPGEWRAPGATFSYKWYETEDWNVVSETATYQPTAADIGSRFAVHVEVESTLGYGWSYPQWTAPVRAASTQNPNPNPTTEPSPTTQPNPSPPTPVVVTPPPPGPTGPTAIVVGKKSITVNGKAKVGSTLKAKVSGITPSGAKVTFKWYAGKKAIKKATKSKLKLTKALRGKKLVLEVTFTYPGLASVVRKVSLGKVT